MQGLHVGDDLVCNSRGINAHGCAALQSTQQHSGKVLQEIQLLSHMNQGNPSITCNRALPLGATTSTSSLLSFCVCSVGSCSLDNLASSKRRLARKPALKCAILASSGSKDHSKACALLPLVLSRQLHARLHCSVGKDCSGARVTHQAAYPSFAAIAVAAAVSSKSAVPFSSRVLAVSHNRVPPGIVGKASSAKATTGNLQVGLGFLGESEPISDLELLKWWLPTSAVHRPSVARCTYQAALLKSGKRPVDHSTLQQDRSHLYLPCTQARAIVSCSHLW